jgi:hypothetical protein
MNAYFGAYLAIIFFLLTPGVLLRLPARSTKLVVALTHGLLFVAVLYFTKKVVLRSIFGMGCMYDGFQDMAPSAEQMAAMEMAKQEEMAKQAAMARPDPAMAMAGAQQAMPNAPQAI